MPAEASMYDAHVEEIMDLRDGFNSYHLMILHVIDDGVVDPGERLTIDAAFAANDLQARKALGTAERIAAAARLVRSLFYAGHTAWVRRVARESAQDLDLEVGVLS